MRFLLLVEMFRFRLNKLLKLRQRAEEAASRELAQALSEVDSCRRAIAEDEGHRHRLLAQRDRLMRGAVRPDAIAQNHYQNLILERTIAARGDLLRGLEAKARDKRSALVERIRERKLLEKLAERRQQDYEENQRRRENRERDDRPLLHRGMSIAMREPDLDRG